MKPTIALQQTSTHTVLELVHPDGRSEVLTDAEHADAVHMSSQLRRWLGNWLGHAGRKFIRASDEGLREKLRAAVKPSRN